MWLVASLIGIVATTGMCAQAFAQTYATALVPTTGMPTPANVLCVYNDGQDTYADNLPSISKAVCDYYATKRPGIHELGLAIHDADFWNDTARATPREWMLEPYFLKDVAGPIRDYVAAHPEWNITSLALAKDLPITTYSTDSDGAVRYVFSTNFMLQFNIAPRTTFGDFITTDYASRISCIKPDRHFDPTDCARLATAAQPLTFRYAVSFLTGFTLADIEHMIDKAQAPAPDLSQVAWLVDEFKRSQPDGFNADEGTLGMLANLGIDTNNLYVNMTGSSPVIFPHTLVAYGGQGQHEGYGANWVTKPAIQADGVANRAIIDAYESYFAITATDGAHPETGQGTISQALSPHAFGGTNYSKSFSGGVGTVFEPSTAGLVMFYAMFDSYASGKTLAESFQASSVNSPGVGLLKGMVIGDPLMTLEDTPNIPSHPNRAPVIYGMDDQKGTFALGAGQTAQMALVPQVIDDGQPAGAPLTATWRQESGPGPASFDNGDPGAAETYDIKSVPSKLGARLLWHYYNPQTVVHLPQAGNYIFQYSVSDGQLTSTADISVTSAMFDPADPLYATGNLSVQPSSGCFSSADGGSMNLTWNQPAAETDVNNVRYNVQVDDTVVARNSTITSYVHKPVVPQSQHNYIVTAIIGGASSVPKEVAVVAPPLCSDAGSLTVMGTNDLVNIAIMPAGDGTGVIAGAGLGCDKGCTMKVKKGTQVSLTEIPGTGSVFSGWNGACSGQAPTCSFTASVPTRLSGTFDISAQSLVAPSVPAGLAADMSNGVIHLSWKPSTATANPVDLYYVYRNGTVLAYTPHTSYTDVPAITGSYLYAVAARDVAGNFSYTSTETDPISFTAREPSPDDPAIISIVPENLQTGDTVTISGTGFLTGDDGKSFNIVNWFDHNLAPRNTVWQVLSKDGKTIVTTMPVRTPGTAYAIVQTCTPRACPLGTSNKIPVFVNTGIQDLVQTGGLVQTLKSLTSIIQKVAPQYQASVTPAATLTPTSSFTPTITGIPMITSSPVTAPTASVTVSPSVTVSASPAFSPMTTTTPKPTYTPTYSATYSPSYSPSYTVSPTYTPTYTATPSYSPTHTVTPSYSPTNSPTYTTTPTNSPSYTSFATATPQPTSTVTSSPSSSPSASPSQSTSPSPSATASPTGAPVSQTAAQDLRANVWQVFDTLMHIVISLTW